MLRRVVAGHIDGKSRVLADGTPERTQIFKATPGMATAYVWSTSARSEIAGADKSDAISDNVPFLPKPGETRFIYLQVAPESVMMSPGFDWAAATEELQRLQPEMSALMEPDHPGMHRTDSIDYVIVLDGEIYLELDDRQEVQLHQHDVVIQIGTRHAWHNRSAKPVLLAVVLVGARRG
jgi:hypothetical protein